MKILITGATSGIGLALTEAYGKAGNQVIACGRNISKLDHLVDHYSVTPLQIELTDYSQLEQKLSQQTELDLVILNAGNCEYINDAINFDGALFQRVIETNVISVGYAIAALLPKIKIGGQLSLMGSSAAYVPFPRAEAYGSSKAAIHYLAKTLQLDIPIERCQISYIAPGFVKTPLTDKNDFPMPNLITAQEAANAIIDGLASRKKEIRFPYGFTLFLKIMAHLPSLFWTNLANRMKK
ncbi:SDR family NAD(P)-dependent oxidoreductase [Vibrio sp. SS-MA-C1-2]|uniref:SDR family NAD(P)-dependent oxidoreductase n=1 Tax=Vibrio sp. SS-MA-C1-2 TaxID=2908646 RepID=UPI001F27157A|nr:SDR family NAD(P)-dependent oxidoreductase [Vibrio sp. SS-MA-C1-2]UJF18365.1 SDR family NAD(P)-dependent oxidoreductase [Vibrio sp. SS-MA-C1-2]